MELAFAFASSEPGLAGRQVSGTGVRVASFRKLETRRAAAWVTEACSWISFFRSLFLFFRFFKDNPRFASPFRGRTALRCATEGEVARSLDPRLRPPCSAVLGSVSGYWGWLLLLLRSLLAPWARLEVHWVGGSDLTLFILFLWGCWVSSSDLAVPASVQNFSAASSFPGGGGDTPRGPSAHWADGKGRGAPSLL